MNGDMFLNMGTHRIFINPRDIKIKTGLALAERISRVRAKYSPLTQLPKNEGESTEDWYVRYVEFLGKDAVRHEGESHEDFMARTFTATSARESVDQLFDYLVEIADQFAQKDKCSREAFEDCSSDDVYDFIIKIMKKCKIPTAELE